MLKHRLFLWSVHLQPFSKLLSSNLAQDGFFSR
jgi:hypothetical protein